MVILCHAACSTRPREEADFFNGRDLTNWSASQPSYWSVEDSAIVGHSSEEISRNQFIWSPVKVTDFYLSVEVKTDSSQRNAGIQFRSSRQDEHGQARGYQADVGYNYGVNVWGTLYHEHGRGLLQSADPAEIVIRDTGWNHYEILASGDRIWIAVNGRIISATEDRGGEREGYIALQIHSGPAQTVRYRIKKLVHDPAIHLAGKDKKELMALLGKPLVPAEGQAFLRLRSGDLVAFAGGTNVAGMQYDGYLETLLTDYFSEAAVKFRNLAWDGDQVDEQFRDIGFGDWLSNIDSINPSVVFVQFGQVEALQGKAQLPAFIATYRELLAQLSNKGRKVIVLSPVAYEPGRVGLNDTTLPDNPLVHTDLRGYFHAIQLMAQREGHVFVDLYGTLDNDQDNLTYDGIHLDEQAQLAAAEMIMKSLGLEKKYDPGLEPLRRQINAKNDIWFNAWRPANWAFYKGNRTEQAFSRHWQDWSDRILADEVHQLTPLLREAELKIEELRQLRNKGQELPVEASRPPAETDLPADDNSIAEELASFKIEEGYTIELFASESLGIVNPCAMQWDEQGRLWVLSIPGYPQLEPGQEAGDRLIVLEDVNRDGKADKSTMFAENLNIPLGFELGHDGVYLGEQTRLVFLKDTNNDLRADIRQTLLSGFGTHDTHQTINSFTRGPAGEIFFAQGLSIHSYIETPWGVKKAHAASIWRYRPRTGRLDAVVDQNTASENPWGISFGDWGELFSKGNDERVFFTSIALGKTDHVAMLPEIGRTRIKSGGVEIPRSLHLPADIRNDILIAGYYANRIERMKWTESGAGYNATLVEPLLVSTAKTFRPVDIKTGPDGALYILDWYNPIIGHYQASLRDPQRDKSHGRVWRITAKNRALSAPPVLANQPVAALLPALKSEEKWVRYQAKRLLSAGQRKEVLPALDAWVGRLNTNDPRFEHHLLEALTLYEDFETVNAGLLHRLLKARNPGARGYAALLAGRWSDRLRDPEALLRPLLDDPHPRVRMMALVGCSYLQSPEAMNLAAGLVRYPMDKFTQHAFDKTVYGLRKSWETAFREKRIRFNTPQELAAVISVLTPEWYTAENYRELLNAANYSEEVTTRLLVALSAIGNTQDIEFILSQPSARGNNTVIDALARKKAPAITDTMVQYLQQAFELPGNPGLKNSLIRLVRSWQVKPLYPVILRLVEEPGQEAGLMVEGINTLVTIDKEQTAPLLEKMYTGQYPPSVRRAAINGFARIDVEQGVRRAVREIKNGQGDVNETRETLAAVIYEDGAIAALTKMFDREGLSSKQASAALIALEQRHVSDKNFLKTIRRYVKESETTVPRDYDEVFVRKLAERVQQEGNADQGRALYRNALNCSTCHRLENEGGNLGPELSAVGSGLSISDIIIEVLWPNKNIKEGYYSVHIELNNGESVQGIKVLENTETISVKASPTAPVQVISKREAARINNIGSSMPGGLTAGLTIEELAHLIKYLGEQKNR